ncbi:MAG: PEGA domain-containing protein, partial [Thermoanaerobaculales bacterium]|nr:PEGA domain-containing protein [Thermoanaerobaculales bacterium]
MSIVISVEIGSKRRVYTAEDLPLSVGGASCHLALTEPPDDGAVAYLGHDRGELFIQAAEDRSSEVPVACNGVPLTASRWLGDRDEIGIGNHRLRCEISGGAVRLALVQTPPPSVEPPVADVSQTLRISSTDRVIHPAAFEPRWQSPPRRARIRIRPRSLVLVAAVALLAAGAWFVLTARAVRVETAPAADHLKIQGAWLTPKIGENYLLRPGAYTVAAELEGYRSLSETLEVNGDSPSVVAYVFEPLGGLLTITSSPVEGAEITIDGESSGTTPAHDIEIAAGEHTVEVVAPLHLPYQTTVVFEPGEKPRELAADLVPNWAPLVVATSPANATVFLDGAPVGSTPLEYRIEAGERVVEIRRQGFKS